MATLSNRTKTAININDVPKTSTDMTNLFKWKPGQTLKGTHAKSNIGMKNYIDDINSAYGKESNYENGNVIYVDVFKPIGEQLSILKG